MQQELINAFYETLLMVLLSGILTLLIGLPLGILLTIIKESKQKFFYRLLNKILDPILNFAQSLPYVLLMITLMPISSFLLERENGWLFAILPLSLVSIPYFAGQCQIAFHKIPKNLIEYMTFLGATPLQIIRKVLISEAWPQLILAFTSTLVQLVGYSAMAGLLGANGLGSLAMQKSYPNFQIAYIVATAILLVLLAQSLQGIGYFLTKRIIAKRIITKKGLSDPLPR